MTATLDHHLDLRGIAASVITGVHALMDELADPAAFESVEYAGLVAEFGRAINRLEAAKLRLIAAADTAHVSHTSGMRDTSSWVAKHTRSGGAVAAGEVKLATALVDGFTATQTALHDGHVSPAHAAVIINATGHLPAGLPPHQREAVEASLVEQAKTVDPATLRTLARRALAAVETDQAKVDAHQDLVLRDEETQARAKTRLTLHENHDGTSTGHFTIPALAAAILKKTLEQMTSPRRGRHPTTRNHHQDWTQDWAHRRGLAFVDLLEHLPTDHLHGKTAATVVVTINHDHLTNALGAAHLDTGDHLSAGETRRIACQAGILPAILGGADQPLNLGRTQRFHNQAQRVALATKHTTCIAEDCDVPYAWTHLHHQTPWAHGGHTNLDETDPLCQHHHHLIHNPTYTHRRKPNGTITFHQRC
jgi:hypothetical protein